MGDYLPELILRNINSTDFIIKTKAIHELEQQILSWLTTSCCGAIIYGRARIGKTKAMRSIADSIKEKYGENFPVIAWDITDHAITEKNFYTSLLMAMGFEDIPRSMTALMLKQKILNALSIAAYETPFRKVVIMLDEAWKLSEKDFSWLMDLYNNLSRKDILLTCFLFGTQELKDFKTELKYLGKDQIIGRFMINEFKFYGIKTKEEIMLCLVSFDNMSVRTDEEKIIDYFFPDRDDEAPFLDLGNDYWNAFMDIRKRNNIKAKDIPMKYFIDSFIYLLQDYGFYSENPVSFPSFKELMACIEKSGYGESDDEYVLSKGKSKKLKTHKRY